MNLADIVIPFTVLGGLGLFFGVGLSYAGIFFKVEVDPVLEQIKGCLPGANCGGCGYTGCEVFAKAVFEGAAKPSACNVGGEKAAKAIAEIMGIEAEAMTKNVAFVKCGGSKDKSKARYEYDGLKDCKAVMALAAGGPRACGYGCFGFGNCVKVCKFGAIDVVDGVAVVNREKCTACGMCVKACPKNLIEMAPYDDKAYTRCNSQDNGKVVRQNCSVGCIGCKICEKACEFDAIHVDGFLAKVDYSKCTGCNKCVEKCPTKAIFSPRVMAEKS